MNGKALAMEWDEFRRLGHEIVDITADYLAGLRSGPVFAPMTPEERLQLLDQQLPEFGASPDELLRFVREHILLNGMGNGHPRFFGWVNSPPAPIAVLMELIAAAMNPSCAGGDHAAIYLERAAVRWLMELIGFPAEDSIGLLVSGGSMANLLALAVARYRASVEDRWDLREEGLQAARPRLMIYASSEVHSCIRKSAELLGLGSASVRLIQADDKCRLDCPALKNEIARDREAGLRPFCVVASAGTVATGAIDPLDQIAELCAAQGLWFHVDGAYGAMGILDPHVRSLYSGLERADSIALDPHKWLSVPVECGSVLIRDAALARNAFSLIPEYLRTEEGKGFGGLPWYSEYGFQQTRGFRALKLWTTLAFQGKRGLEAAIVRHNRLARQLAERISLQTDFELLFAPVLSIVCFRYAPENLKKHDQELDALNKRIMERLQSEGRVFLTNATIDGRFALRACILHYATQEADLDDVVGAVRQAARSERRQT